MYVAAAAISQKLPGLLCIKRKQATILCHNLVPEEMADCIVPLHCLTGCDATARVNSLDIEEEAIEELFEFTRLVVCGDKVSRTIGTAQAAKWKAMKKKSFICLPAGGLHQHCLRANYLAYLVHRPSLKDHPSPLVVAVVLSATHVPLSRHNFLNLSYQKTVGKMKVMMTRKTVAV